ncbi:MULTISPECIES: hypothetical protein [unclassified Clostridium]|uniref:hypothetical protein n=1 Tax=unclassified Clostridium TaxID=2614128 RepID=UPI0025B83AF0|nr:MULTISPECIES: hypothetical protein [unclassified Clostridium]
MRVGQGLLLKLDYADGAKANKKRTFLIIDIGFKNITLLNVSSVKGKTHKLLYPSNFKINKYNPPFVKSSFVKLDAEYIIEKDEELDHFIVNNGRAIHPEELKTIRENFRSYSNNNKVNRLFCRADAVTALNRVPAEILVASDDKCKK